MLACLAVVYFFALGKYERNLSQVEETMLTQKLHLAAKSLGQLPDGDWHADTLDTFADDLSLFTGTTVVILAPNGSVLGDSSRTRAELLAPTNYAASEDVRAATRDGFGRSIRISSRLGSPVLDLTVKVKNGFLRFETPWPMQRSQKDQTHLILLAALAVAALIGIVAGMYAIKLSMPVVQNPNGLTAPANFSQHKPSHWHTILESISEGIMITDASGVIIFANSAFLRLFAIMSDPMGKTALESLRSHTMAEALQNTFKTGIAGRFELTLLTAEGEKIFDVLSAPIVGEDDKPGVLSVMHDITWLRALEKMRSEFVANVSHEFKTPLTSIIGYAEALQLGDAAPDTTRRFAEKILKQGNRLKELVDDTLTLSRIESSEDKAMSRGTTHLSKILSALNSEYTEKARKNNLTLTLNTAKSHCVVRGREQDLFLILGNLLDNAIKYTPQGGSVEIDCEEISGQCVIRVKDSGMGIDPKDHNRIFERFYRVDHGRSRDMGGTGLGLAIVKHTVTSLGGTIKLTSRLGGGSVFSVFLPLA